ncbi:MAG: hypothetical protein E7551_08160 [Ruminococcaceae bacterium]|nr:hypothetical protein [Oscillospiraceae bacterium]
MFWLADPYMIRVLKEYEMSGGKIKYIFQPYMPMDQEVSIRQMMSLNGTIGIYHQGTTTDYLFETGGTDEIKERIKLYRTMGCIKDKRYGDLIYLDLFRHSEKPNWSVDNWLNDIKLSGGVVRDLHIHDTDMVLNLLGMPKSVYTSGTHTACKTVYEFENSNISVTDTPIVKSSFAFFILRELIYSLSDIPEYCLNICESLPLGIKKRF